MDCGTLLLMSGGAVLHIDSGTGFLHNSVTLLLLASAALLLIAGAALLLVLSHSLVLSVALLAGSIAATHTWGHHQAGQASHGHDKGGRELHISCEDYS